VSWTTLTTTRHPWIRRTPPRSRSRHPLRSALAALFVALSCALFPSRARAASLSAVEIEPRAEAALDARALRRLIKLELGDLDVPPRAGRSSTSLFVRVLSASRGEVRVELWELGGLHGERLVLGGRGSPQLVARRVALAVAELARNLRNRRHAEARAEARAQRQRRRDALAAHRRTREGPLALRSSLEAELVGPLDLALAGTNVYGQVTLGGPLRLDFGLSFLSGALLDSNTLVQSFEVAAGPARRLILTPSLDLDLGMRARAGTLLFAGVSSVDATPGQREALWARAELVARVEPRVSRALRLSFGVLSGLVLRRIGVETSPEERLRLGGVYAGIEAGIVFTPPPAPKK
jgi:hypothetical protein